MARWLVLLLALAPLSVLAVPPDSARATGYLHGDLVLANAEVAPSLSWTWEDGEASVAKRSVPLAFLLSAALPGAGQAYNESWVRAAVFAGLEVALWTGYASWRGQGLDGRDAYRVEAHRHWSPARYGAWLRDYDGFSGDADALTSALGAVADVDFRTPDAWTSQQEQHVRALVRAIRDAEDVSSYDNGAGFSHQLPFFGAQQYYELIGKYYQFNPGWSDWQGGDLPVSNAEATRQFLDYAEDHGSANDFLRRASRVTAVIAANHVLSAFDALLTARLHNLRLESDLALVPDARGDLTPVASVRVQF